MMKFLACAAIFLCVLFASPHRAGAEQRLLFGVPEQMAFVDNAQRLLQHVYSFLGYSVEFHSMPLLRSLTEADHGHLDGELCRMEGLAERYPNLMRVRVPLCSVQGVAVVSQPLEFSSWEDFAGLRVTYRRGAVGVDSRLPAGTAVILAPDLQKSLDLVVAGRVDAALLARSNLDPWMRASQYEHLHVIPLPFARIDMYHYLHKRHADLVPRVEAALRELLAE